jgi:hypothetical protein
MKKTTVAWAVYQYSCPYCKRKALKTITFKDFKLISIEKFSVFAVTKRCLFCKRMITVVKEDGRFIPSF